MTAPDIETVLFDLDGTLVDTKTLYLECYRLAVEPRLSRRPSVEELMAMKPRSEIRFLERVVGQDALDACLDDFHAHYASLHDAHFGGVYDGVAALLDRLRARGCQVGIVTGKSRRAWSVTGPIAALGEFDALVLDDDVGQPKPSPEGIRAALRMLDADPARTVYVGDTTSDMNAALDASVQPIAALWGRGGRAEPFARSARGLGAWLARQPRDVERFIAEPSDDDRRRTPGSLHTPLLEET